MAVRIHSGSHVALVRTGPVHFRFHVVHTCQPARLEVVFPTHKQQRIYPGMIAFGSYYQLQQIRTLLTTENSSQAWSLKPPLVTWRVSLKKQQHVWTTVSRLSDDFMNYEHSQYAGFVECSVSGSAFFACNPVNTRQLKTFSVPLRRNI